jgi:uncharacterized protein
LRFFAILLFAVGCTAPPGDRSCTSGALGIEPGAMTPAGVSIAAVLPDSPADAVGLREGDVLVQIGDRRIAWKCELDTLLFPRDCAPVRIIVTRGGETLEKTLAPVERNALYEKRGSLEANADSVEILEASCDRRIGAACTHLGYLYAVGKIVAKDDLRSLQFYTRGCSAGDAHGCYNQGLMRDQGRGLAMSATSAAPAYEQACLEGIASACTNLGYLYEHGRGVMRDAMRATGFYRRGCEGSPCSGADIRGCVNLGDAYRDGIGVDKNPTLAAETFRKACASTPGAPGSDDEEARVRGCVLLGALEISGLGVAKNIESGLARSLDGCNRGDAYGCFNVAALRAFREDFAGAASFYRKACDGGDAEGCYELGVLYDEAKGVPFDYDLRSALFQRACKGGFDRACGR